MSSYGVWLSAAGMQVQDHRQTLLANNLANAQTSGFKQDLAVISRRQIESREGLGAFAGAHPVLDGLAGGINVRPAYKDFLPGDFVGTGRPLDAAIDGSGFFTIKDGDATRYTRDGNFTLSSNGDLVLSSGNGRWKVVDEAGVPIRLDENGGKVAISSNGTLRQGSNVVGRLGLAGADDEQKLRKSGENLFEAGEAVMTPATPRIVSETLEQSNFDVMSGLVGMIEATRAYEMNARLVQMQDEATGQAITRVASVA